MGPFDFITDYFSGTQQPAPPPLPVSEQPPSVFTPNLTGPNSLAGVIGTAAGVPSHQQRLGAVDQEAQSELSRLLTEEKLSPQQAIAKFIQSDAGIKYFGSGYSNPSEMFKSWTASITPPEPTQVPIAAGNSNLTMPKPLQPGEPTLRTAPQLAGPGQTQISGSENGQNGTMGATTPQMARQGETFVGAAQPGANPPLGVTTPQMGRPGEVPIGPGGNGGQPGQPGNPLPQTIQNPAGTVASQITYDANGNPIAKPLQSTPKWEKGTEIRDNFDKVVGHIYFDQLSGESKVVMGTGPYVAPGGFNDQTQGNRAGNPRTFDTTQPTMTGPKSQTPVGPVPGTPPPASHPTIRPDQQSKDVPGAVDPAAVWDDKRTMFLGSGIAPIGVSYLTGLLRQFDPALDPGGIGAQADANRAKLDHLRQSILQIRDNEGLGANKATVQSILDLTPTGGPLEDPVSAIGKGILLRNRAEQEMMKARMLKTDSRFSAKHHEDAGKLEIAWANVLDQLPSKKEMDDLYVACKTGQCGALTPRDMMTAASKALDVGMGDVRGAQGGPPQMTPEGRKKFLGDIKAMPFEQLAKIDPSKFASDPEVREALKQRATALATGKDLAAKEPAAAPKAPPKKGPAAPPREVPKEPTRPQNANPGGFTDREGNPQRLDGSSPKAQGRVPGSVKTIPFRPGPDFNQTFADVGPGVGNPFSPGEPPVEPASAQASPPPMRPQGGPGSARYQAPPAAAQAPRPPATSRGEPQKAGTPNPPSNPMNEAPNWVPPRYNFQRTPFADEGLQSFPGIYPNNPTNPFREPQPQTAKVSFTDQSGTLYELHVKEGRQKKKKASKERD